MKENNKLTKEQQRDLAEKVAKDMREDGYTGKITIVSDGVPVQYDDKPKTTGN